jgi:cytochrome c oxidase subunit 4
MAHGEKVPHVRDTHQDGHLHGDHTAHVVPIRVYVLVFLALMLGTWLTVEAAGHDFGRYNMVVALAIAITKATLVVLFFMHVKYSGRLIHVLLAATLGCLLLALSILTDYFPPRINTNLPNPSIVRD